MAERRGRPYDTYGRDRNRDYDRPYKKHISNDIHHKQHKTDRDQQTGFSNVAKNKLSSKSNPFPRRNDHHRYDPDRLPLPKDCYGCKFASAEMRTGIISLLDQLEGEELGPKGDSEILHHTRELHRLLSSRGFQSLPSKLKKELDEKYPSQNGHIPVPPYLAQRLQLSKSLPPLPQITEPYLKEAVFTHRSVHENPSPTDLNYERLEFLGDAYIEIISSRLIFTRLPHLEAGQQSGFREQLVRNEKLALFANAYGFGDRIAHGGHENQTSAWTKILADVFEAYVAAVILSDPSHGFNTVESWLTELWTPQLLEYKEKAPEDAGAKDEINKLAAAKGVKLEYRMERDMEQVDGVQKFWIGLYLSGWGYEDEWLGSGEGQNKNSARNYAAMDALRRNRAILDDAYRKKLEAYPALKAQAEEQERRKKDGKEKGEDGIKETKGKALDSEDEGAGKKQKKRKRDKENGDDSSEKKKKKKGKKTANEDSDDGSS